MNLRIKRAYEPAAPEDGERWLVDRLWPRGVKKEALGVRGWLKEVAPSDALRRWFGHDPARWEEFRRRYLTELGSRQEVLQPLREALGRGPATLVYAAHDQAHNHAQVLREFLLQTPSSAPMNRQRVSAPAAATPLPVTHDGKRRRFEIRAGDKARAFVSYTRDGDSVVFDHTYVPDELRGRGLAAILVRAALGEARRRRWRVVPRCSYVARFIERHTEFADLVDRQNPD